MEHTPIVIGDVSSSFFSIARYSGGAKIQGELYIYHPERDILIKSDWEKYYRRLQWEDFINAVKSGQKPPLPKKDKTKKQEQKTITPSLFTDENI